MKKLSKDNIFEAVFYLAVMIELMIVILEKSAYIIQYEGHWFRLTFALFFIKAVSNRYTRKQWIGLVVIGCVAVISYMVTGRNEMLRIVALVVACKDIEPKRLLKLIFWTTLIGCGVIVFLSLVGIGGEIAHTEEYRVGKIETRYCFGMGHPNSFHGMVWALIALGGYIYREKLRVWHYALMFVGNIVIFLFTDSRTAVLLTAMVIVMYCVMAVWKTLKDSKWFYVACMIAVVICFAGTIIVCVAWLTSDLVRVLDRMLSYRIQVVNMGDFNGRVYAWTLFGLESNTYYFDMGIARLFYWYGWIPGILYLVMNLHLIAISYKKQNLFLAVLVVTSTVYTIIEAHLISEYLLRNYLFVLYGLALTVPDWEKDNKREYYLWNIRYIKRGLRSE